MLYEIEMTSLCFQFVTEGSDQSIVKPIVEYCVVCGDKASGRNEIKFSETLSLSNKHEEPSPTFKSFLYQGAIMELSAVRAVKASSNAALERTWCTRAGAPAIVLSTRFTETAASTVDCSAA